MYLEKALMYIDRIRPECQCQHPPQIEVMKYNRSIHRIFFSLAVGGLLACSPPGPLEQELVNLEKTEAELNDATGVNRDAYSRLVQEVLPLIDQKRFVHQEDIKKKTEIMYRASLIAAVSLHRLEKMKAARELFMNAYLLNEKEALADIRAKMPSAHLKVFEDVRIPEYRIITEKEIAAGEFRTEVMVQEVLPYFLLQMVCGAVLRNLKDNQEKKSIRRLLIYIRGNIGLVATGRWDQESDQIVVKLPTEN